MKRMKLISLILLLVLIDQGIKIYVKYNMLHMNFNIIGEYVQYLPKFNREYSWINALLGLGIGRVVHIIFVIFILGVLYLSYGFIMQYHQSRLFQSSAICIFSGTICSLIDKVLWNGSLDYILLKGLFIFDLKDVYISIFEVLVILMIILYYKEIKAWNGSDIRRELVKFIRKKIKRV